MANQKVLWQPLPGPQTWLVACPCFEVFFGGARGGGKTEGSLGDWLIHSATYGEKAVGIFFRRELVQLSETIDRAKRLYYPIGAKYKDQAKEFTMPGGGRLKFAYLDHDEDAEKYQGHEYTRIYIEEATNFPDPTPIRKLFACLRTSNDVPVGMRLTGNPGGPGHLWVKARYIDPCPAGMKVIETQEEIEIDGELQTITLDRVFIPSRLKDNPKLLKSNPRYTLQLKAAGNENLVKAWLDGNWDVIDGAFFSEWDRAKHVLPYYEWIHRIPRNAVKFRAMDWGSAKPFSIGWYAISDGTWGLPRGALLKYREWYGASDIDKGLKLEASQVARGIREREAEAKDVIKYGVADGQIFARDGGPSIAETMSIAGVSWRRADKSRKAGAEQLHHRLVGIDGVPMLYFLDTCIDTIRTIPALQHDSTDAEDVNTKQEDHAYDETRYACMSRPWIPKPNTSSNEIQYPKLPGEMTISELIAENSRKKNLHR